MNVNSDEQTLSLEINTALEAVDIGFWLWRPATDFFDCTASYERIMHDQEHDPPRRYTTRKKIIHPDDYHAVEKQITQLLNGSHKSIEHEFRLLRPHGRSVWVQERLSVAQRDEKGAVADISGLIYEINKIKQAEISAEVENQRCASIAHLAGLSCWQWDVINDHFRFNDDSAQIIGRHPHELNGSFEHLKTFIVAEDVENLQEAYDRSFAQLSDRALFRKIRCLHASGRIVWVLNIASVAQRDAEGRPTLLLGGMLNIDKAVRTRKRLCQSLTSLKGRNQGLKAGIANARQSFSALFAASLHASILIDDQFHVVDCNPAAVEFFAFPNRESLLSHFTLHAEQEGAGHNLDDSVRTLLSAQLALAVQDGQCEFFVEMPNKPIMRAAMRRIPYRDSFAVLFSFTERHETEEDIHASERRRTERADEDLARVLIDSSPMICAVWDVDGKIIDCNLEAPRLMGLDEKSEYINRFYELNPILQPDGRQSRQKADELIAKALETGYQRFEWEFRTADGQPLPSEVMLVRVVWNHGYHILAYSRDLREIKKANAEIERHTNLLQKVNEVAADLISADIDNFDEKVVNQLRELGRGVGANQASVWENYRSGGEMFCRQSYLWDEDTELKPRAALNKTLRYNDAPFIKQRIFAEESVNSLSGDLPETPRDFLDQDLVKALLIIPIRMEHGIWGFIRFDNRVTKTLWSKSDRQALQSCGILMASAILRNRMTGNLVSAKNELLLQSTILQAVNDAVKLLLINEESDPARILHQCLEILGKSINADRVALWKNFTDEHGALHARRISGWVNGQPFSETEPEGLIDYATYLPEWDQGEEERKELNMPIRYLPEVLRNDAILNRSLSLLLTHIDVDGEFWGFIGFTHDHIERLFRPTEIEILRSGGVMLASAIIRDEAGRRHKETFDSTLIKVRAEEASYSRVTHQLDLQSKMLAGLTTLARGSNNAKVIRDCLNLTQTLSRQLLRAMEQLPNQFPPPGFSSLSIVAREFDLGRMLSLVVNMPHAEMAEKKQRFHFTLDPVFKRGIVSDEKLIALLLSTLLDNAVKYTPTAGRIQLHVRAEESSDSGGLRLIMEVIHTESGIQEQTLRYITELFAQDTSPLIPRPADQGLGLVISKSIVDALHGTITLQNDADLGNRFVACLPVQWGKRPAMPELLPAAALSKLRVLIAAVYPEERKLLRNFCAALPLHCDLGEDIEQTKALIQGAQEQDAPYDVLIWDQRLFEQASSQKTKAEQAWMKQSMERTLVLVSSAEETRNRDAEKRPAPHMLVKPLLPSALYAALLKMADQRFTEHEST